jgi:hypothetical protein
VSSSHSKGWYDLDSPNGPTHRIYPSSRTAWPRKYVTYQSRGRNGSSDRSGFDEFLPRAGVASPDEAAPRHPGPCGGIRWSTPRWWPRLRPSRGRNRAVRTHPSHTDHWAGTSGWDRLCHPKVTDLIPYRGTGYIRQEGPALESPEADERVGDPRRQTPAGRAGGHELAHATPICRRYARRPEVWPSRAERPAALAAGLICLSKIIWAVRPGPEFFRAFGLGPASTGTTSLRYQR